MRGHVGVTEMSVEQRHIMYVVEWHPYPEKKPPSDKVREYLVTSHETVTIAKFPVQHWMSGKLQSQYDEFEEIRSEMLKVTAWAEMPEPYVRSTK